MGKHEGQEEHREGHLIEPEGGVRCENALGGFLEEVISELGTGEVLQVRLSREGQRSKQKPRSEIKANIFEPVPGSGRKMGGLAEQELKEPRSLW